MALFTPSQRTCPSISVIRSGVPFGWQWNQKISGASTPSGYQQPLRAAGLALEFVAGKIGDRLLIEEG